MTAAALSAGRAWPLGASVDAQGVNFAVFSANATAIDLCLFSGDGADELQRLRLPARSGDVWHGHLAGAGAGLVYGLRAHGPWAPHQGHRFDAGKLLLDPFARETVGDFDWADPQPPRARVVHDDFDWQGDRPPATPWSRSVLYEVHVRGFSMRHPDVPEAQRGTYAGLASEAALAHFKRLGVTALSLLPVQQFIDEERLVRQGLRNYWGYNTLAFFCPEPRYGMAGHRGRALRDEFRRMVQRLHAAGIEVILDVVYNHTAETDEFGPTLSWRGLDNAGWYRLVPGDAQRYVNHSGCGNTLDLSRPHVLQMVMDSLRWWVQQMHVDGFRFDLAAALGRTREDRFDREAAFFACIAQDPVLAPVKLIAEPWDIGPGGYQLGHFPTGWAEWNDRFRDTVRAAWLAGGATRGELARRLCASSDLFQHRGRAPSASLNYIVSHDGFTLRDLLTYEQRRNQANGEDNRDGHQHNLGWNCGIEGPSEDPAVQGLRARLQRALLATLLLAQGTPMLAAGDELGHSQGGNNNPYCQDNATTWIDWSRADQGLIDYCAELIALRRRHQPLGDGWYGDSELQWRLPDGRAPAIDDWHDGAEPGIALHVLRPGAGGRPLLLLLNPGAAELAFALPPGRWQPLLDSAGAAAIGAAECRLAARSLLVLQQED